MSTESIYTFVAMAVLTESVITLKTIGSHFFYLMPTMKQLVVVTSHAVASH